VPIFIKSAVPGLSTRAASMLQVALLAGVALLAALPRANEAEAPVATAQAQPVAAPPPEVAPQQANIAFSTIEVVVTRNDTMDRLFRRFELNLADLATLRGLPELRAQLDRLKPGELLRLMHRGNELVGLERKLSDSETLKITRDQNGFSSDVLENPLEVHTRTASATIESSLFQAAADAKLDDRVAFDLAEIFQYDIDFVLDIQSGDRFTVVYEEIFQDGAPLRTGKILAAKFVNEGREYRAVRYVDPQGNADYFTPDGRSLRKAFIRAPVQFSRVSSRFNPSRRHPVLNTIRAHKVSTTRRRWELRYARPVTVASASSAARAATATSSSWSTAPAWSPSMATSRASRRSCIVASASRSARSSRMSEKPAWRPVRTCTTNIASAESTRIRRPFRCRTRNPSARPSRNASWPRRPNW
jgi:murein DD-endopeptidase MepM/ murein hydrolase activator NlpD